MIEDQKIIKINIEEEMKAAYIDYSMSVIVSRALPDVRDGLKPVHRRILYGMYNELHLYSDKKHKKSARIVGEVLGKFHPHGDVSIYNAMARMAQPWSLRYMLVDGQGNFGSQDGDSPAAMRYTEARLQKISEEIMADIEKDTVNYTLNFDDSILEPTVLPTKIPLLLINGTSGIAVGMATNMPPHNLTEVINATCAYIDNREVTIDELCHFVKAPDFPTGGIIYGYSGIKEAYATGRGRVVIRSKVDIEKTSSGRDKIVITEIPYLINKAEMIKKIADLINDKKIEGISYINDESDRNGTRIIIILKSDALASVVLNKLYKYSELQSSFAFNSIALVNGRPKLLNLKEQIHYFVEHRHDVVMRRTKFELLQAEKRAHILDGLLIAQKNIDEVIRIIRGAKNVEEAKKSLMDRFSLSETQTIAITEMRLRSLTALEHDKLQNEFDELQIKMADLKAILGSFDIQMSIIKEEMIYIRDKYGDERRTEIVYSSEEFNPEDFYADDDMVITISHLGYIKRTPLVDYRTQGRGGVGSKGSATRDADFIEHIYISSMHETMLFFTELGRCFWLKVYEIPEGTRTTKGRALQNVIQIAPNDKVRAYLNVKKLNDEEFVNSNYIILSTKNGIVKKTLLAEYSRPRQNGVNAINIKEGDQLLAASITDGTCDILLATKKGKANRFNETNVRAVGRVSQGVRGINIGSDNEVISMIVSPQNTSNEILVLSENGYGKRTSIDDYSITNRGSKGVKTLQVTEKTGELISMQIVTDENDLMVINRSGMTIRVAVSDIRMTGRAAQGVKVINLKKNDSIASVATVPKSEEEEEELLDVVVNVAEESNEVVESLEVVDITENNVIEDIILEEEIK